MTNVYVNQQEGNISGQWNNLGHFTLDQASYVRTIIQEETVSVDAMRFRKIAPSASVNEVLTYLHTDHLGTPRVGSDSSGASVWSWDSDAFGNVNPTGTSTVNLRLPVQYWDD